MPFLLDVQSEVFSRLGTRLCPVLPFQGQPLVAVVPELAGIPRRELGPVVGDLAVHRAEILAAMDLLLAGF